MFSKLVSAFIYCKQTVQCKPFIPMRKSVIDGTNHIEKKILNEKVQQICAKLTKTIS